jgi:hypothetical protein
VAGVLGRAQKMDKVEDIVRVFDEVLTADAAKIVQLGGGEVRRAFAGMIRDHIIWDPVVLATVLLTIVQNSIC